MMEAVPEKRSRRWMLALLLVTGLAVGLRFYHIDRLPPGLHYDEAFNNLLALRLPQWNPFPVVFFEVEFGRSVLHPHLIALLFEITGPIVLGGRLVSAIAGSLTVPLLFFAVREMFRGETEARRATQLGLAAALSLAILFWHVHQSRIGMESIMVPALITPAFGLIWRALRRQSFRDAGAAGALLGITGYAYPTAIFLPLLLALFFGGRIIFERGFLRESWRSLVIVTGVALLVLAPLGFFFARHSQWLTLRSGQVASGDLLDGVKKVVKGLFTEGDRDPRDNLPGRPILDPIQVGFFLLGLGICLARRRPPHLFLISWLIVMMLPSVSTDYPPNYRRLSGAAPAVAALVGLGAVTAYDLVKAYLRRQSPWRRFASGGAALLLTISFAWSGVRTARDYFLNWGESDDLFIAFDVGLRWIGEYAASLPQEERVYVTPTDRFWKTLEFLLEGDPFRTHNYNGRRCVVFPAVTETPTTHIIIVTEDPNSLPTLQAAFPDGGVVEELYQKERLYAVAYRTPANRTAQIRPARVLEADFDGKLRLLGYDPPAAAFSPGDTVSLRLYWRAEATMSEWYKVFVHLWGPSKLSEAPRLWGQEDTHPCDNSYFTPWWAVGEVVADGYRIPINPDAPPGEYQVWVGLYQEGGPRLPVVDLGGDQIGDHVALTTIRVSAP